MGELLYNIKDVFSSYLKEGESYNIPAYQRGYKWTSQQVNQLLDDIAVFETNGNDDIFYCLQNVTLVKKNDSRNINVVDGQQRLTTLVLLLAYLEEKDLVEDKLNYAVRKPSNDFIQKLIDDDELKQQVLDQNDFIKFTEQHKENDLDYQDIYFMYTAFRTISKWFEEKECNKDNFKSKFLKNVKLIINRIDHVEEQELFLNLNTGRVQLDGADLVRAILITRVAKEEMAEYDSENVEDILRLNERRIRIGWELDEINYWWSKPEVKKYFSSFSKIPTAQQETIHFNVDKHSINLLYKLWTESQSNLKTKSQKHKYIKLAHFEASQLSALELYHSILGIHRTLKDWFEDRTIYHYLGFLFQQSKTGFFKIWQIWNEKNITREGFCNELKKEIQLAVFGKEPDQDNQADSDTEPDQDNQETGIDIWLYRMTDFWSTSQSSTNWYESDNLEKILILLDIIAHIQDDEQGNPLPFLKPQFFSNFKEDKEHIFPGTPKDLKVLKGLESPIAAINEYITKLNEYLNDRNSITGFQETEEVWLGMTDDKKENLSVNLKNEIQAKFPINSIGNLVLLHLSINRGFGNNYYDDKRTIVINNTKTGYYVRNHTLDVFIKNTDSKDLNTWTMGDIKKNANTIKGTITDFFDIQDVVNDDA